MRHMIKYILAASLLCLLTVTLFSCSDESSGIYVTTNRWSQIKTNYKQKMFFADSLSYYENPDRPMVRRGEYIWYYYWSGEMSHDKIHPTPNCLAYIDPYSCEAVMVCQDKKCSHYTSSITHRCILTNMVKDQLIIENEEYIYYIRENRETYSEAHGGVVFVDGDMWGAKNVQYTYELVKYQLGSGSYDIICTAEFGDSISHLTLTLESLYYIQNQYVKDEDLVYQGSNDEYYYFQSKATDNIVVYPSMFFRQIEGLLLDRIEDGYYYFKHKMYEGTEHEVTLEYKYPERFFTSDMPAMKVVDDRFAYKTYLVMKTEKGTTRTYALNTPDSKDAVVIDKNPQYFGIIKNRIYIIVDNKFLCYDLDMAPESEYLLCDFSKQGKWYTGMTASDIQFDQYTDNIYFKLTDQYDGGTIAKVKAYGNDYRQVRKVDVMCGHINSYQLTLEGVYFTVSGVDEMDGNIYLIDYLDVNYENAEYDIAYDRDLYGKMYYPTAIFGQIYAYKMEGSTFPSAQKGQTVTYYGMANAYRYDPETKELTQVKLVDPKDFKK